MSYSDSDKQQQPSPPQKQRAGENGGGQQQGQADLNEVPLADVPRVLQEFDWAAASPEKPGRRTVEEGDGEFCAEDLLGGDDGEDEVRTASHEIHYKQTSRYRKLTSLRDRRVSRR